MTLNELKKPLAIAMWDSSWLRRRYEGGGFESFDRALDELLERGYNAVRIDPFPHMIANAPDGTNAERFLDPPSVTHRVGFAAWGSPWTVYIYPRRDVVEFLRKCEARGIRVLLSTWLKPTAEKRNELLWGKEDLVRIWDETLLFLKENDCLGPVIGVDVQNEIPYGACNTWLYRQMNALPRSPYEGRPRSQEQIAYYRAYFSDVIRELKMRWSELPISASLDHGTFMDGAENMDFSCYDFLDVHMWAENAGSNFLKPRKLYQKLKSFGEPETLYTYVRSGYLDPHSRVAGDIEFEEISKALHESWYQNRALCEEWLESRVATVSEIARRYGIPCGNTEGWGPIHWLEHPLVSWDMVKDAGIIGARLGKKYGYAFNCQSNFCEPQFRSLWKDVDYHRSVTDLIRGKAEPEEK